MQILQAKIPYTVNEYSIWLKIPTGNLQGYVGKELNSWPLRETPVNFYV